MKSFAFALLVSALVPGAAIAAPTCRDLNAAEIAGIDGSSKQLKILMEYFGFQYGKLQAVGAKSGIYTDMLPEDEIPVVQDICLNHPELRLSAVARGMYFANVVEGQGR